MARRVGAVVAAMALIMLSVGSALAIPTEEQLAPVDPIEGCTYFDVTGHNLCGDFEAFWNGSGGLPVFGYALTEAYDEQNPDTGETYLTQYLERQRFELHPANAGTVYHVLLGRLGAQILEMNGRDWFTFPKADPSADHYFAETGHAIAPQFWEYWSTHGLEYGDPGVSFRESLLLFGYPISEPAMETNPDGDTVLTQWFERARFEWHEDDSGGFVLLGRLGAELAEGVTPPEPTVIADELDNPRHQTIDADGNVWVAEAGSGGDQCVTVGEGDEAMTACFGMTGSITNATTGEVFAELPSLADPTGTFSSGPIDVAIGADGDVYVVMGEALPPGVDYPEGVPGEAFGTVLRVSADGTWEVVADLIAYEVENNPAAETEQVTDGAPEVHSNPYGLITVGEDLYVSDAGGNDILKIAEDGTISTFAVFEPVMVPAVDDMGQPTGEMRAAQPVPTDIVEGEDGVFYVTLLAGEAQGYGQVLRVEDMNADGDALDDGEVTTFADGFTMAASIAADADGNLYVGQIINDFATLDFSDPETFIGGVFMVAEDGTKTELAEGQLHAVTGVSVNDEGEVYLSTYGVFPELGKVVELPGME